MKYGMKNIVILALAMGLVAACAGDDKSTKNVASDPIKARQSLMKSNIGNLKAIGAYLKTGKGSAADVAARARNLRWRQTDGRPLSRGHELEGQTGRNSRKAWDLGEKGDTQSG